MPLGVEIAYTVERDAELHPRGLFMLRFHLLQAVKTHFPHTRLLYWMTAPGVVEERVKKAVYHSGRPPLSFRNFDNHKVLPLSCLRCLVWVCV